MSSVVSSESAGDLERSKDDILGLWCLYIVNESMVLLLRTL